jgi:hypothetical protein
MLIAVIIGLALGVTLVAYLLANSAGRQDATRATGRLVVEVRTGLPSLCSTDGTQRSSAALLALRECG